MILTIHFLPKTFGEEIHMLYMAQSGYQPADIVNCANAFKKQTGITVSLQFAQYEDQYNLIQESSKLPEAKYDIILLDLIWTADFAERQIIIPIPKELEIHVKKGIIPEIYRAFYYEHKLWAVPFLANFQLFYTNMDLLHKAGFSKPPDTLEEAVQMAKAAKKRGIIKYPFFDSFKKQEALVCEYVWVVGAFGGNLTDSNNRIRLLNAPNIKALSFMVNLLKEGLMNPYSLKSEEVFAAEVFTMGDALFTTNWTFLSGLIKKSPYIISKCGRASLIPVAQSQENNSVKTSTVSGFQGLSVTQNSKHKKSAWRFIQFLSSPAFQKKHLEEMSVWKTVWSDPNTMKKDPDINLKKKQILGVHNRPIHPKYRKISSVLQEWIYKALLGKIQPKEALLNAQKEINQIIR